MEQSRGKKRWPPGDDGLVLTLIYKPASAMYPRPEDVASILEDIEGLYRAAPAAEALGIPVSDILLDYRTARAEATTASTVDPSNWKRFRRRFPFKRAPFPEWEEFFYLTRYWQRHDRPPFAAALIPPEHPLRLRRLRMESPLEIVALVPSAYCTALMVSRLLRAIEDHWNMAERIKVEKIDLKAKEQEREADRLDAELRAERTRRELDGLRHEDDALRLVAGAIGPDLPTSEVQEHPDQ